MEPILFSTFKEVLERLREYIKETGRDPGAVGIEARVVEQVIKQEV